MRSGLWGRDGATGLGRGRMEGRQRGGDSSGGGGRIGLVEDGITGSGIGPLTLVAGVKKLFQDVSVDVLNGIPA
jgi:hypothetical protein